VTPAADQQTSKLVMDLLVVHVKVEPVNVGQDQQRQQMAFHVYPFVELARLWAGIRRTVLQPKSEVIVEAYFNPKLVWILEMLNAAQENVDAKIHLFNQETAASVLLEKPCKEDNVNKPR